MEREFPECLYFKIKPIMSEKFLIDSINIELEVISKDIREMFDSYHRWECCETHYLDFDSWETDFSEVERKLEKIDKIEIYGEEDMGITIFFYEWEERVWIFVPWRWYNNWYYSSQLDLIVKLTNWFSKTYDISKFQDIEW